LWRKQKTKRGKEVRTATWERTAKKSRERSSNHGTQGPVQDGGEGGEWIFRGGTNKTKKKKKKKKKKTQKHHTNQPTQLSVRPATCRAKSCARNEDVKSGKAGPLSALYQREPITS